MRKVLTCRKIPRQAIPTDAMGAGPVFKRVLHTKCGTMLQVLWHVRGVSVWIYVYVEVSI